MDHSYASSSKQSDRTAESEDPNKQYEIEKILKSRDVRPTRGRGRSTREYFVKWKGYDSSHNIWVPRRNFASSHMIREFEEKQRELREDSCDSGRNVSRSSLNNSNWSSCNKKSKQLIHSIVGIYDDPADEDEDENPEHKFVVLLKDQTKAIRTSQELRKSNPGKLIKFYEGQIKWTDSTFTMT